MKNFRFPLQSVLVWRDRLKENEQRQLEVLLSHEAHLTKRCEDVQNKLRAGVAEAALDASDLHRMAEYKSHLRMLELDLNRQSESCQASVVEQRAKCLEAQRQHKILEKLKDQKYADWKRAIEHDAEAQSAETYAANWLRTKRL